MRRRTTTAAMLGAAIGLAVGGSLLFARPGTVVLKDGGTYAGEIVETPEGRVQITRTTNGRAITTEVDPRNVARIDYQANADDEFAKKMAALAPTDVDGRIALARSAFDARQYRLAHEALESALQIDPNSAPATELLGTVQRQMRLERNAAAQPAPPPPPPAGGQAPEGEPPPERPQAGAGRPPPRDLLSPDQVALLKQFETSTTDRNIRVRFDRDVRRRFIEHKNLIPNEYNAMSPTEQALLIFQYGTDAMKKDVHILSDPPSVLEFRRAVQNRVLQGCATAGCHGSTAGGNLILFTPGDDEQVAYTNYLILQQYTAQLGGNRYRMIDRNRPADSLLLQYGLPPETADLDHPQVPGGQYRPIFRGRNDPFYQAVGRWISQTMNPVEPEYQSLKYSPPTAASATQPAATRPAGPEAPPQQPGGAEPRPGILR